MGWTKEGYPRAPVMARCQGFGAGEIPAVIGVGKLGGNTGGGEAFLVARSEG